MALSFSKAVRCILLVSDDALHIYNVAASAATLVEVISWDSVSFVSDVINAIRNDCRSKPVLILCDITDQHFKGGQRIPPVGVMDKNTVINRKLQVAFPNYEARGALHIKDRVPGGEGSKERGDLYLFAAVPLSEQILKTIEAVKLSLAPVAGFVLLPIEAADMVDSLATGKGKKRKGPPSRWVVFMGQHKGGGLRQVITRDGKLAMTRMTPVTQDESDPVAWAEEVAQEFKATVSYLSRFGYNPNDSMDVISIASRESGEALGSMLDIPCNYKTLTSESAAEELGLKIGRQDSVRYAEPLHVAWIGRKSGFTLPMDVKVLKEVHTPRQAAAGFLALLILGIGFLGWLFFSYTETILKTKEDLGGQQRALEQAEINYRNEAARLESLGFDVRLIRSAINTYEEMESDRMKALPFIVKVDRAMGHDMRLDAFSITAIPGAEEDPALAAYNTDQDTASQGTTIQSILKLSFPPTLEEEEGVAVVNDLRRRLEDAFSSGYSVKVLRNVAGLEYSDEFSGRVGRTQTAEEIAAEDRTAEISIEGPVRDD